MRGRHDRVCQEQLRLRNIAASAIKADHPSSRRCLGGIQPEVEKTVAFAHMALGELHGRNLASALMRSRVHNRTRTKPYIRIVRSPFLVILQFGTSIPQGGHPPHHSMISSAAAEKAIGTSMPSALAVLRLRINSYLTACMTGSSPGFSPLRMRAT